MFALYLKVKLCKTFFEKKTKIDYLKCVIKLINNILFNHSSAILAYLIKVYVEHYYIQLESLEISIVYTRNYVTFQIIGFITLST